MNVDTCGIWDNGECVGTPLCPPRCPRFFDAAGRAYVIRPLGDGEIDSLVEMYVDFAPEHRSMGIPPETADEIREWVRRLHRRGSTFVAWDGERAIGHAGYSPDHEAVAEFFVFVHQDYHGRGLGTELTKQAIAYAADAGHDALRLHVTRSNEAAVHVYRRLGFEQVRDHAAELEMELSMAETITMEVRLPPAEQD